MILTHIFVIDFFVLGDNSINNEDRLLKSIDVKGYCDDYEVVFLV